ncbi:MAG: bifunctional nuclease family protein [Caldilineae bacterium]|nr:MAG: bifunctional nuclease family protein [Caldilineae bacterium]
MIEVTIDSIRVSLMSQHRVILLKEVDAERYLAIWIGPDTAEAIHMHLQKVAVARPMTHDLMKNLTLALGARVSHIIINELRNDVFYARIILDINGRSIEVDSRPSDALALAVRTNAKIFVHETVMDQASIRPEVGLEVEAEFDEEDVSDEKLDAFRDFVDSLDLDDLG